MATPILPFAVWESGTNQNSIPANDNSLRNQILNGLVISKAVTAQPGSPADGDIYILAATHTGAQWAGFDVDDLVIFSGGTWYAFAPEAGVVVNFEGHQEQWTGSAGWAPVSGGGGGGMTNPMTTAGDIITGGSSGTPQRLAAGTNTHVLTMVSGAPAWAAAAGGGGSVAGSDKQVQYNNAGAFGAEAGFEYDQSTNTLTVAKINEGKGTDITSSGTTDIASATGNFAHITGSNTITAFGTAPAGARRIVVFDGSLTLTHNATSLILPTGANITTAAGDAIVAVSEGSGNWRVTHYQRKDGTALVSGGSGLANWTESVTTATPNATVPAVRFLATNAATNVDAVLSPKGTGSFLAQVPNNLTTGGNKRGIYAVDLQMLRSGAGAGGVASGDQSVLIGGHDNTNSGGDAFIGGGNGNFINGAGQAGAVGGTSNTITGQGAFTGGGGNHTVSGILSAIIGGEYGTTRGTRASVVQSSFRNSFTGDLQCARLVVGRVTTDATPTSLSATGGATSATNTPILPNASAFGFTALITARSNTAGDSARYRIEGLIKRGANAASTALVGTPTVTTVAADTGASAWAVAAIANTTLGGLEIQVTGAAATTIKWACIVETVEVVGT